MTGPTGTAMKTTTTTTTTTETTETTAPAVVATGGGQASDDELVMSASASCVGCGLVGTLDSIIQHASTCKVIVNVEGNKGSQSQAHGKEDSQGVSYKDLTWLPPSFTLLKRAGGYVTGTVDTEEELEILLANHKKATLSAFNRWYNNHSRLSRADTRLRIMWKVEDYSENTPLSVTKRVILDCQHGKEHPARTKAVSLEHVYTRKKHMEKRVRKLGCPAKVFIRHMKRYDAFRVKENATKFRREETMKKLRQEAAKTTPETSAFILVKLPLMEAHQNHPMDPGQIRQRRRSKVIAKTLVTAEPIAQQQETHMDTPLPESAPLETAPLETAPLEYVRKRIRRKPRKATLCPVCIKPFLTVGSHLKKVHKIVNRYERALLLDLAAKRVDIRDAACPIEGCTYKSDRLYTHLLAEGHPGLSREEAETYMNTVRKERTVHLLAALRASQPCPAMATTLDLQTSWVYMPEEHHLVVEHEEEEEEEAFIPTYTTYEVSEVEVEPQFDPYAKHNERCCQANQKLTLENRRLKQQISALKAKYKHLEAKHRACARQLEASVAVNNLADY